MKQGYFEAIVKSFFSLFLCLLLVSFSRFISTLTGERAQEGGEGAGRGGAADICRGPVPTLLAGIVISTQWNGARRFYNA